MASGSSTPNRCSEPVANPKATLDFWQLRAKKRFGQHFLKDPSISARIVHLSGIESDDVVVEIGAGLGALTVFLSEAARCVIAVEKDPRLIPVLQNRLSARGVENVEILQADVLQIGMTAWRERWGRRVVVVGNLPYYLSSQILIRLINGRSAVRKCVLMFQKELAGRVVAPPGSRQYGRLSVLVQYCARVTPLMRVDASRFFPMPRVDSEVLEFLFKDMHPMTGQEEKRLFEVVGAAFGKRRKTLKNALSQSALGIDAATAESVLKASGIVPSRRAETLTAEEYVHLTKHLQGELL